MIGTPFNIDLNLGKKFKFRESRYVMFRAEAFKALNHPQFIIPASTIGSAGGGSITSTARPARQIQLALKLVF